MARPHALGIVLGIALFVAVGLLASIGAGPAGAPAPAATPPAVAGAEAAAQLSQAFATVAARVRPAVVGVYSERTVKFSRPELPMPFGDEFFERFFGPGFRPGPPGPGGPPQEERGVPRHGMGSGIILDAQGHILTNYHVVRDVDEIQLRLEDRRRLEAEVVGTDPETDVAVIRIKGEVPGDLPTARLGDSDALDVGHLVMAIGAPFGFLQTVTTGVVSAKDRSGVGINDYEDFLQTDAAINPGNSGGPLVNMNGEVVGINSAIVSGSGQFAGVGFAIPINMVKTMLPALLKGEKVVRGQLGVIVQEITPELARQFGVERAQGALVGQVAPGSPAAEAGLRPGDIIVRFGDAAIADVTQLRNLAAATRPGTRVKVEVLRDGKPTTLAVTIGTRTAEADARTPPDGGQPAPAALGMRVQTLTPQLARELGIDADRGVLIAAVEPGSRAAGAGLRRGDVIIEAGRKPVASADDLQAALRSAGGQDGILLRVRRGQGVAFVVVPLR